MGRFGFLGEEALELIVDDVEEFNIMQLLTQVLEDGLWGMKDFFRFIEGEGLDSSLLFVGLAPVVFVNGGSTILALNDGGALCLGDSMSLLFGHEQHKLFDRGWFLHFLQERHHVLLEHFWRLMRLSSWNLIAFDWATWCFGHDLACWPCFQRLGIGWNAREWRLLGVGMKLLLIDLCLGTIFEKVWWLGFFSAAGEPWLKCGATHLGCWCWLEEDEAGAVEHGGKAMRQIVRVLRRWWFSGFVVEGLVFLMVGES